MSVLMHATIPAWQRDHDGSYTALLHGWSLRVRWRPESAELERGFWWEAERPGAPVERHVSDELHEEIEVAMAHAEQFAAPGDPERKSATLD
jgi:hypothetical protein